jgi:hypothetical protein
MQCEEEYDEEDWNARQENEIHMPLQGLEATRTNQKNSPDVKSSDELLPLAILGDKCPICLQQLEDPVMISKCYHVYCFNCLNIWAQSLALHGVKPPTCPLCKGSFRKVYADVRSETDYTIVRFDGKLDPEDIQRTREASLFRKQKLLRRSIIYRKKMRLSKINGAECPPTLFPSIVKVKDEYQEWLERELHACIGEEIDLTLFLVLIDDIMKKSLDKLSDVVYTELETIMEPFLKTDTKIFIWEFSHFVGSRLNMQTYDAALQYDCTDPSQCMTLHCACKSIDSRNSQDR